ncbi:hypothetical protein P12x_000309 [Tundrisphaera lichenicola]|uniref:hypothetical protein n=1 Tax=Tundrisphaera lichenicola TaxID=2029860 RepID=UPI003EB73846
MRLPHFRLTVRMMMFGVVVVALLLWGGVLASRSIYYEFHARGLLEKQQLYLADTVALERRSGRGLTPDEARLVNYGHRMVDFITLQRANYRRAARYPWLPIESIPPVPKY